MIKRSKTITYEWIEYEEGDQVECTIDLGSILTKGRIYTVTQYKAPTKDGDLGEVILLESPGPWKAACFKPVGGINEITE